jgi:hypothetical protein
MPLLQLTEPRATRRCTDLEVSGTSEPHSVQNLRQNLHRGKNGLQIFISVHPDPADDVVTEHGAQSVKALRRPERGGELD